MIICTTVEIRTALSLTKYAKKGTIPFLYFGLIEEDINGVVEFPMFATNFGGDPDIEWVEPITPRVPAQEIITIWNSGTPSTLWLDCDYITPKKRYDHVKKEYLWYNYKKGNIDLQVYSPKKPIIVKAEQLSFTKPRSLELQGA